MISVIIPVYNTETYLPACVESLLSQTYADFELLLIDDGSQDKSPDICDNYTRKDKRVKVIHKRNEGVSAARNTGIEASGGEYITFIDSDDWVAPDYLQSLSEKLSAKTPDLVTSGLIWWEDSTRQQRDVLAPCLLIDLHTEEGLRDIVMQSLITSPVGKLYRRKMIVENKLRFDTSLSFAEDRDFNVGVISVAKTVVTTDYTGYYYRRNLSDSLSALKPTHSVDVDLAYWVKLHHLFASQGYSSGPTRKLLAERLYYIVSDAISSGAKRGAGIKDNYRRIKRLIDKIPDRKYLADNVDMITAPRMVKNSIVNNHPLLLTLYYKLLRLI